MGIFSILRNTMLGAACAMTAATSASAQNYPERPIEIICGFVAGGGADVIVRFMASKLEELTGNPVVVHNRVGAFGNIAMGALLSARPDGHTMLMTGTSTVVGNLFLLADATYDPREDIQPVATLLRNGFVLTTGPDSEADSVAELIEILKEKGDEARFGQSSVNSLASAELFLSMTGTTAERINYQSSTDMVPDLMANDLDFGMIDSVFALNQAAQGRIKLLAGTPDTPVPGSQNLPTMQEAGVDDYVFAANWGAWFPAGTPDEITVQMHGWLTEIMDMPETREFLANNGAEPVLSEYNGLAQVVEDEYERWQLIAELAGFVRQ